MTIDPNVRVLHLISSFQMGGAEKLLLELISENKSQLKVNFVVVIMNDLINDALLDELQAEGVTVHLLKRPPSHRHPKYLFKLLSIIRRDRIQIIHTHDFGSKLWAVLCKLAVPRLKLVFTIHTTNIISKLNALQFFIHLKVFSANIAISNTVEQECIVRGLNNAVKIYNGIRIDKFKSASKSNSSFGEPIRLVNVARLTHKTKGQDILIRAVKLCRDRGLDVSCTLIGGTYAYDTESMPFLKALTAELGISEHIHFAGNLLDVHLHLANYDIFILPSRYEGLGLVVLEAMAAGLPVIAANIDGPAELIEHGVNGLLFQNEQPEDLAEQIVRLSLHSEERLLLTEEAARRVSDYDMSVMLGHYTHLYSSLV
ncbi:glycosyltransferase [Paenibacillus sp. R14(2021)]|uniref:glycosyltransferase n=1 Tax=Paenibacillus sp. R14(2021) TaxID=2859228 RepID=UPI001C6166BB|nr:glycosyltransferase [Paenibacillus sp. R14(2021)]